MSGGRMVPRDFHVFGPLRKNTWLASDVQPTSTPIRLSPPSYRHLTVITCMLGYKPHCHAGKSAWISVVTVELWCVPSATRVSCTHWSRNKPVDVSVFVTLFLYPYTFCLQLHWMSVYRIVCMSCNHTGPLVLPLSCVPSLIACFDCAMNCSIYA